MCLFFYWVEVWRSEMGGNLLLEQALASHLGRDIQAHDTEDGGSNVAEGTGGLCELMVFAGHDEGYARASVGGVWGFAVVRNHLFSVSMVCSDKENISVLFTGLVDLPDGLIRCLNAQDRCFILASVANHIRRCKVAHHERELASGDFLCHLLTHLLS